MMKRRSFPILRTTAAYTLAAAPLMLKALPCAGTMENDNTANANIPGLFGCVLRAMVLDTAAVATYTFSLYLRACQMVQAGALTPNTASLSANAAFDSPAKTFPSATATPPVIVGQYQTSAASVTQILANLAPGAPALIQFSLSTSDVAHFPRWACFDLEWNSSEPDTTQWGSRFETGTFEASWPASNGNATGFTPDLSETVAIMWLNRPTTDPSKQNILQQLSAQYGITDLIDLGSVSPVRGYAQLLMRDATLADFIIETSEETSQVDCAVWCLQEGFYDPNAVLGGINEQGPSIRLRLKRSFVTMPGGWFNVGINATEATADSLPAGDRVLLGSDVSRYELASAVDNLTPGAAFVLVRAWNHVDYGEPGVNSFTAKLSLNIW